MAKESTPRVLGYLVAQDLTELEISIVAGGDRGDSTNVSSDEYTWDVQGDFTVIGDGPKK